MLKRGTVSNLAVLSCVSRLHNTTESVTVCIMKLNTNAGPRTNRNILRRGGTIPDPWRTILYRRYTGLGGRG